MKEREIQYAVLVLAAGESRRYGSAKQLALIEGEPMIRHVLCNVIDLDLYHTVVVIGAHADRIQPIIADIPLDVVVNSEWASGISASVRSGISFVQNNLPQVIGIVIVLGDQWQIKVDHVRALIANAKANPELIVATNYAGEPGVPVYFPRKEWPILSSLQGDEGAKQILQSRNDIVLIDLPEAKIDLDYPKTE